MDGRQSGVQPGRGQAASRLGEELGRWTVEGGREHGGGAGTDATDVHASRARLALPPPASRSPASCSWATAGRGWMEPPPVFTGATRPPTLARLHSPPTHLSPPPPDD